MKKILLLIAFMATVLSSCQETDNVATINEELETEYELVLNLSSESISIDKGEIATFTVEYNGEDVTANASIIDVTAGGYEPLSGNKFTTLRPGVHTFFASYKDLSSENISLMAINESNVSSIYYRRTLVTKYTATTCTYCPDMSKTIKNAKNEYPNRLCEMAIHSGDQLSIDEINSAYCKSFSVTALPTVVIDMTKEFTTGSRSQSFIVNSAKQSMVNNPTVVGIKADVAIKDDILNIDVQTAVTADGTYKIIVALLQSGFNYSQSGADASYTQDHVVRGFFQDNPMGDLLGMGSLVAGEKVDSHYELDLTAGADQEMLDRSEILICVLNDVGDAVFNANNVITCSIGESKDYEFEPILDEVE